MSEVRATTLNGKKLEEEKLKTDRGEISQLFSEFRSIFALSDIMWKFLLLHWALDPPWFTKNQGPCVSRSVQYIYDSIKNHNFLITNNGKLSFFLCPSNKRRARRVICSRFHKKVKGSIIPKLHIIGWKLLKYEISSFCGGKLCTNYVSNQRGLKNHIYIFFFKYIFLEKKTFPSAEINAQWIIYLFFQTRLQNRKNKCWN